MDKEKSTFIFKGYTWDPKARRLLLNYQIKLKDENFNFTERLEFPQKRVEQIPPDLLEIIFNNLLLALGTSYYKLFIPKEIKIEGCALSKEQAEFWNTLYTKGLGEFFYKNQIDFRNLINFPYSSFDSVSPISFPRSDRALLGIGGGKDSIVAGELLKSMDKQFDGFVLNEHVVKEQSVKLLGVKQIVIKRQLDPQIIELNKRPDTYNGHIPISAQYAFIGLLTAILNDYRYVVMGNEQSASFGNIDYLDQEINHQWSKSEEFESMLRSYIKKYITPDIYYFSILRPFTEIKIVELFSKHKKYFSSFSSCNRNFKINGEGQSALWCGECAKCAFVFVMLSAFIPKNDLVQIFGQNLFIHESLLPTFKELLGITGVKPFDCVGTPDEVKVAFYLASKKGEYKNDLVMEFFEKEVLPNILDIERLKNQVFKDSVNHDIPDEFRDILNI